MIDDVELVRSKLTKIPQKRPPPAIAQYFGLNTSAFGILQATGSSTDVNVNDLFTL